MYIELDDGSIQSVIPIDAKFTEHNGGTVKSGEPVVVGERRSPFIVALDDQTKKAVEGMLSKAVKELSDEIVSGLVVNFHPGAKAYTGKG